MQNLSLGETYWSRKRAEFYLWTIRRQHHISATIRTQLMSAVSVVLLFSILLPIRLETALYIILYTGLAVIGLLWALIERRRSWLLGIQDPVLRALEKNNTTSCLPVAPSPAFHPPAHIPICTGGCAFATNPHSAPYCGIIYFHDPRRCRPPGNDLLFGTEDVFQPTTEPMQ